jgi:hypothetical protein
VQDFAAAGILSDNEIHRAVGNGRIQIDPFNPEHMNPTSYDLTLGNEVAVYKNWVCVPDPPWVLIPSLPNPRFETDASYNLEWIVGHQASA